MGLFESGESVGGSHHDHDACNDVYVFHRQGRHREEENQNHQDRGPLWADAEEGGVSEEPGEEEGEEEVPQL